MIEFAQHLFGTWPARILESAQEITALEVMAVISVVALLCIPPNTAKSPPIDAEKIMGRIRTTVAWVLGILLVFVPTSWRDSFIDFWHTKRKFAWQEPESRCSDCDQVL